MSRLPIPALAARLPVIASPPAAAALVAAAPLLAASVAGAVLRVLVSRLAGADPRSGRLWLAETSVAGSLAILVGVVIGRAMGPVVVAPVLGAGLTTYAAASGFLGLVGSRALDVAGGWRWALAHAGAAAGVGALGLVVAVLLTRGPAG